MSGAESQLFIALHLQLQHKWAFFFFLLFSLCSVSLSEGGINQSWLLLKGGPWMLPYLLVCRLTLPWMQGEAVEHNVLCNSHCLQDIRQGSLKAFPGWSRAELLSVDGPLALLGLLCCSHCLSVLCLQVAEEEYLIQELRKIETRKKEREKRTQDLQKLITAADTTTEQRRAERKAPKKKLPQKKETEKPVNIFLFFSPFCALSGWHVLASAIIASSFLGESGWWMPSSRSVFG